MKEKVIYVMRQQTCHFCICLFIGGIFMNRAYEKPAKKCHKK